MKEMCGVIKKISGEEDGCHKYSHMSADASGHIHNRNLCVVIPTTNFVRILINAILVQILHKTCFTRILVISGLGGGGGGESDHQWS